MRMLCAHVLLKPWMPKGSLVPSAVLHTCCMLVSLSCTSNPPCTMGNRFCLSGFLLAFMQRSSQRVVR